MKNLKNLLKPPHRLQSVHASYAVAVLVVALLGFADAAYLALEHFRGVIPPCTLVEGCETVLTSSYAQVMGIPVALIGAIFYLIVAFGAFAYLESKREMIFRYSLALTVFGFLGSAWFMFAQIFILKALCVYCILSAITSTVLFVLAILIFRKYHYLEDNV